MARPRRNDLCLSEKVGTFSDKRTGVSTMQSVETQVISRIYGNGRGWVFSQKDFAGLGTHATIDRALCRLHTKGTNP